MCVCVCACVNQNVLNFLIGKVYTLTHTLYIYTTYIYIYSKLVTSLTIRDHLTSNLITNLNLLIYIYLFINLFNTNFILSIFKFIWNIYKSQNNTRNYPNSNKDTYIYIYIYIPLYEII